MQSFRSQGKLLLTGEYAVLDGIKALALPTSFGQSMTVSKHSEPTLKWESFDEDGSQWFKATLYITHGELLIKESNDSSIAERLIQILAEAVRLNKGEITDLAYVLVQNHLDFKRLWGLGTSSTLINNISQWLKINPYKLLDKTFGGSGYDIACATAETPIIYTLSSETEPKVEPINMSWPFTESIYFVYLNKKQNSRAGIRRYKEQGVLTESIRTQLNEITDNIIISNSLREFNGLLKAHDEIIGKLINMKPVQQELFSDFSGYVKSLGAWGGDFVLVSSETDPSKYFKSKGYSTILPYEVMIKKSVL